MSKYFPSKWAILLGPKDYKYVKSLQYSTRDIVEVGKLFRERLNFEPDKVLEFGTDCRYQPIGSEFHNEVGTLFESGNIHEDDLLVFYFSGHGIRDENDFLLPADATPRNLKKTALQFEDLVADLTDTKCKNIVMFIDACREAIGGDRGIVSIVEDSRHIAARAGFATIFSCEPFQLSYEIDEFKLGSFTYCFLNAINNNCATLADMYKYLLKEVQSATFTHKKQVQRPYPVQAGDIWDVPIFLSDAQRAAEAMATDDLIKKMQVWFAHAPTFDLKYFEAVIEFLDFIRDCQLSEEENEKLNLVRRLTSDKLKPTAFIAIWDGIEKRRLLASDEPKAPPDLGSLR